MSKLSLLFLVAGASFVGCGETTTFSDTTMATADVFGADATPEKSCESNRDCAGCCRVTYLKVQSRIPATLRDGGGVGSHHALTGTLSRTMM